MVTDGWGDANQNGEPFHHPPGIENDLFYSRFDDVRYFMWHIISAPTEFWKQSELSRSEVCTHPTLVQHCSCKSNRRTGLHWELVKQPKPPKNLLANSRQANQSLLWLSLVTRFGHRPLEARAGEAVPRAYGGKAAIRLLWQSLARHC